MHPRVQELLEQNLSNKEITFLDFGHEGKSEAYLFIENLYDENDSLYLHLVRRDKGSRGLFYGELKRRINDAPTKEAIIESFDFSFDPKVGSTTMVNIAFTDGNLENLEVQFSSASGIYKSP